MLPAGDRRWATVLDFLADRLPAVGREAWRLRLSAGDVLDDGGQAADADLPYRGGGRLYYWRALDDEPVIPFEATVLFQDAHLLVVDKPHFLPVTPTGRFVQPEPAGAAQAGPAGIETLSPDPPHRPGDRRAGGVQPAPAGPRRLPGALPRTLGGQGL